MKVAVSPVAGTSSAATGIVSVIVTLVTVEGATGTILTASSLVAVAIIHVLPAPVETN